VSLPKPDLHVRVSAECKAALQLLAEVDQVPESVIAARLIEDAVLGKFHALRLAARQMSRMGIDGSERDE